MGRESMYDLEDDVLVRSEEAEGSGTSEKIGDMSRREEGGLWVPTKHTRCYGSGTSFHLRGVGVDCSSTLLAVSVR